MINDYSHLKHKCLMIPFSYFRESMNNLYGTFPGFEGDSDSMHLMWSFDDNNRFMFTPDTKWIRERCHMPLVTMDDIEEFFYVDNIINIATDSKDMDAANVYIIYD